jgi:small neutral amino acid transporter SnatA (MarC family)
MEAIAVPKTRGPIRLKTAAIVTAFKGDKTFVATTVAIAFAESWKPFIKSNIKARIIVIITKVSKNINP